jgi:hypothetical protein
MVLIAVFTFLLFAGYSIFFRSDSRYSIPLMQKKDIEALEVTCNNFKKAFSKCKSVEDLNDKAFLKLIRKRTKKTKHIDYAQYAYLMGDLWADYYNKRFKLIHPTPKIKPDANHCSTPV